MYNQYNQNYDLRNTHDQYSPNHSSNNTYVPYNEYRVDRTIKLQNKGNNPQYRDQYLDINPNTGAATLFHSPTASGTNWRLTELDQGYVHLQNLGISSFKNWFLGRNPNSGTVMVLNCISPATTWLLENAGNGEVRLRNLSNGQYLDFDPNTGDATLFHSPTASGTKWLMT
ncbi:hypothetical protein [Bacillus sp. SBS7]|uniref:hypothetical protein n=1 Tax=Bacillus sp. SBS7 TaxID=3401756 RepID=UPI003AA9D512